MKRNDLTDLAVFAVVAEEKSFTRAAGRLGMAQSAVSHAMRQLEQRLGIRLLSRTTRSVATTEAGQRLLRTLAPALRSIDDELAALSELQEKPRGTVRITTPKHPAMAMLMPVLGRFLPQFPEIRVEVAVDESLTDIVEGRYDAGIRLGERVEQDMIAVPISPEIRQAVVGSPGYFARRSPPETPHDLARHSCLNYRMATSGALYPWEFDRDGQSLSVRVEGSFVANDVDLLVEAALDGLGLAHLFADTVEPHVRSGRLISVLQEWCEPFPGFYLYYPSRRQNPPALASLIDALRWPNPT